VQSGRVSDHREGLTCQRTDRLNEENEMEAITNIAYGDAQARGQIRHWKKKLAERDAR
jgi:hypothetical protein